MNDSRIDEGQREDRDQGAAEVPEEDDADERDDDRLLDQLLLEVVDRALDQVGAVVGGDELDALGERGLDPLLDRLLDVLDDAVGVDAVADDHDPARDVALAVQLGHSPAHLRPEVHARDVLDEDRASRPAWRRG